MKTINFLKTIFKKKDKPIRNYAEFWVWFQKNEKEFHSIIKSRENIEEAFLDKIILKLEDLREGCYFLTGMYDENTVELIFTANGNPKNIFFIEELFEASPKINGWKFTLLKQANTIENCNIEMEGFKFNSKNLFFYSNETIDYPDEIYLSIIHLDMTDENKKEIMRGTFIFLDNYLGELDFLNNIDDLKIINKSEARQDLVPISKLKAFLNYRQKEFIEKYEDVVYETLNDNFTMFESELENGNMLLAMINTDLLNWDRKASHPWVALLKILYDGSNNQGLPNSNDYEKMNEIEEEILNSLLDIEGNLNIGIQTSENARVIYFCCKDFRKPSKVFYEIQNKFLKNFEIEFEIYKDKYWQTFERFNKR